MFLIYCHTNKKNGKRYVGWTSTSLETRWCGHLDKVERGSPSHFHNAIRKWGESDDVWEHMILQENIATREEAKEAEVFWITELKTFAYDEGNHGYNQTRGGDGAIGYRHNEQTRELIREKRAQQVMSPCSAEKADKIRVSNQRTLRSNPEKCHIRALNVWKSRRANRVEATRPVLQFDGDTFVARHDCIFDAFRALGKDLKLYNGSIKKCCNGVGKCAYGYSWRWADNESVGNS